MKADLNLCWENMSEGMFSHVVSQPITTDVQLTKLLNDR